MSQKINDLDNISALHEELNNEIEADKLYWIRNDAKIRACTTSETYDHFRNIVNAAHLTPILKDDKNKKPQTSWNKSFKN